MRSKEDDMTSTMNRACPLCGLRFASNPLLELHIREDHRQHHGADPGGPGASPPPASASRSDGLAFRPSRTIKEMTAMTATGQPRPGQLRTALRSMIRPLWDFHDELVCASEAMMGARRAPHARSRAQAPGSGYPDDATEPAGRAA
jgi:hypothetical protein